METRAKPLRQRGRNRYSLSKDIRGKSIRSGWREALAGRCTCGAPRLSREPFEVPCGGASTAKLLDLGNAGQHARAELSAFVAGGEVDVS